MLNSSATIYNSSLDAFFGLHPDHRIEDFPILNNPYSVILLQIAYLAIIYLILPYYMTNKPAYNLKYTIYSYNLFQIFINSWVIYEFVKAGWNFNYYFGCVGVDQSRTPENLRAIRALVVLFLVKIVDFIETGFFILRRKWNQVSFLHVFHHVTTPLVVWITGRYIPGGSFMNPFLINCLVHVIMYSYYQLAAWGVPNLTKWKKLVTRLQLGQFVVNFINLAVMLSPRCQDNGKILLMYIALPINLILLLLFTKFYFQAYKKNKTK